MEKVTISQIKNHLSRYIRMVRAGESVLILDRDRPVARLDGLGPGDPDDDRLVRLERDGALRRATAKLPWDLLRAPAATPRRSVLDALLEERQKGR